MRQSVLLRSFTMTLARAIAICLIGLLPLPAAADAPPGPEPAELELIMVEQAGCAWCARWSDEIGPIYAKTTEAATAPLRRIDLRAPVPDDLDLDRPAVFTPTFILVKEGAEVGRIEGYPGPDFFWPLLDALIVQAEDQPDE